MVALEMECTTRINPLPDTPLLPGAELILIGATEAERRFVERFGR